MKLHMYPVAAIILVASANFVCAAAASSSQQQDIFSDLIGERPQATSSIALSPAFPQTSSSGLLDEHWHIEHLETTKKTTAIDHEELVPFLHFNSHSLLQIDAFRALNRDQQGNLLILAARNIRKLHDAKSNVQKNSTNEYTAMAIGAVIGLLLPTLTRHNNNIGYIERCIRDRRGTSNADDNILVSSLYMSNFGLALTCAGLGALAGKGLYNVGFYLAYGSPNATILEQISAFKNLYNHYKWHAPSLIDLNETTQAEQLATITETLTPVKESYPELKALLHQ